MSHVRALALVTVLSIAAMYPATARAAFGFLPGDPVVQVLDAAGEPYALAGGHPDRMLIKFGFNQNGEEAEGNAKNIVLDFPPGFVGDPNAVPACPRKEFEASVFEEGKCDPDTQIGVATVYANQLGSREIPIYIVDTAPGQLALAGSSLFGKLSLLMRLRPDDFGLRIEMTQLVETLPVAKGEIELWGVPADHQEGTSGPRRPFLTLPARCDQGGLTVTARTDSWEEPEYWVTATGSAGMPLIGCDALAFEPALSLKLASRATDSPSGATLDVTVPQIDEPDGRAAAAIDNVDVTLPAGVSISAGAIAGVAVCSDAELGLGREQPAECPGAARVGSLSLDAPELASPLEGGVYMGQERPGERFRLFLVAEGHGVSAKFVGVLRPDPATGRITVALKRLPALGFSRISLKFDDGPKALLVTPVTCGKVTATAAFERYDGLPAAGATASTEVTQGADGQPCPATPPFSPRFSGGTTSALAGHGGDLSLTFRRQSGEQDLGRFAVTFPPGLSARFDSAGTCADGAVANGVCPANTRVGSAIGEVGSGSDPALLSGEAYLTGPYRRAPFGLALVFRAAIGHFDLGTIIVRAALRLDPSSGRISVQTDALPGSIEGVPIRFQTIGLDIDRPDFVRTPTSCDRSSFDADLRSTGGAAVAVSSPFRLRGCNSLRFAPRLSVHLIGDGQLSRGDHPAVGITIRSRGGGANLRSVDIGLPPSLHQDLGGLRSICSRQDALEGSCPADSRVGRATAASPLFRRTASGPVSLVQPANDGPPELWATLAAEGVRLFAHGQVLSRGGRVHTKLAGLPDVPLTKLVMRLDGGSRGLLSLAANPCARGRSPSMVSSALEGQNRAYLISRSRLAGPACADPAAGRRSIDRAGRLG